MIKIWLDDVREPPDWSWHIARTANGAVAMLSQFIDKEVLISLDHDLGDVEVCGSGYDVAKWIEMMAFFCNGRKINWQIHSANPVGCDNMRAALESADRMWEVNDERSKLDSGTED